MLEQKNYIVTLRHDGGRVRIQTAAGSTEIATDIVLRAERAPRSAVISVREIGPYPTITSIKEANRKAGQHFFEPATMRFFASRILRGVIGGRYFITSEQFHGSDGYSAPRKYSVRMANNDGSVDTVGEFNSYETPAQARAAARELAGL